ncbi:MAG: DUF4936 family protein [Burkholderiales bacterium]
MSLSYYVYYRSAAAPAAVRAAVITMQASLAGATGVQGRLLRRVEEDGTWMEIYEGVSDPERFERELAAETAGARLEALLAPGATRHVERFTTD